jgi:hypothetical protein
VTIGVDDGGWYLDSYAGGSWLHDAMMLITTTAVAAAHDLIHFRAPMPRNVSWCPASILDDSISERLQRIWITPSPVLAIQDAA